MQNNRLNADLLLDHYNSAFNQIQAAGSGFYGAKEKRNEVLRTPEFDLM